MKSPNAAFLRRYLQTFVVVGVPCLLCTGCGTVAARYIVGAELLLAALLTTAIWAVYELLKLLLGPSHAVLVLLLIGGLIVAWQIRQRATIARSVSSASLFYMAAFLLIFELVVVALVLGR